MRTQLLLMAAIVCALFAAAQPSKKDSTVLTFEDYLSIVLANHPIIKQANLKPDMAAAELQMARGLFDPKLEVNRNLKNFEEKRYYDLLDATLKVPTWFPIDPKITLEQNKGAYVNPMDQLPADDNNLQISSGITIPLGRGLFIDERRSIIKQSRLLNEMAQADQLKTANKVLLNATKDYLNWSLSYQRLSLYGQSITLAEELYRRVILDYSFGEAAVVDTIQASINLQKRKADYEKSIFDFSASGYAVSNNLWGENNLPLELQQHVRPDTLYIIDRSHDEQLLVELIEWSSVNHPDIQKQTVKNTQLTIEKKLAKEYLKPQVDLSYSLINAPINPSWEFVPTTLDNYKLGIDVYFPLLLRKERGKLELTNLKIQNTELEIDYTKQTISNRLRIRYSELEMTKKITNQYQSIATSYEQLLNAELVNLEMGESDLFKLNIQQDKFIESQLMYLDIQTKYQQLKTQLLHDAGNLYHLMTSVLL